MDAVDEMVLRSALVCLVLTSQGDHSLHPSLTEARGSHLIQGFLRIQPPDQVASRQPPLAGTRAWEETVFFLCAYVCVFRLKERKCCGA